jgi:hypothetical protein
MANIPLFILQLSPFEATLAVMQIAHYFSDTRLFILPGSWAP